MMGGRIASARKARKWSQSDLGERIGGVDRRLISAMEKGDPSTDIGLIVSAMWLLKLSLPGFLSRDFTTNGEFAVSERVKVGASATLGRAKQSGKKPLVAQKKGVVDNDF